MQASAAVAVLGKSQGTKPHNRQLEARLALGAALWHASPEPKPLLLYAAEHDVPAVRSALLDRWGVPPDRLVTRRISHCTFVEVRALRDLCAEAGAAKLLAVTHPYHAARTRAYLREVLPEATVIPAHESALAGLDLPAPEAARFADLRALLRRSQPDLLDEARERLVEAALRIIHALDRSGTSERALANFARPRPPRHP
ncbi:MAG: YdcF family protein [Candidatus Eiseniibacteriota bacterium]